MGTQLPTVGGVSHTPHLQASASPVLDPDLGARQKPAVGDTHTYIHLLACATGWEALGIHLGGRCCQGCCPRWLQPPLPLAFPRASYPRTLPPFPQDLAFIPRACKASMLGTSARDVKDCGPSGPGVARVSSATVTVTQPSCPLWTLCAGWTCTAGATGLAKSRQQWAWAAKKAQLSPAPSSPA